MQITQSLSQRMEQKLVMTRQMIQSIEMLQLPDISILLEKEAPPLKVARLLNVVAPEKAFVLMPD